MNLADVQTGTATLDFHLLSRGNGRGDPVAKFMQRIILQRALLGRMAGYTGKLTFDRQVTPMAQNSQTIRWLGQLRSVVREDGTRTRSAPTTPPR